MHELDTGCSNLLLFDRKRRLPLPVESIFFKRVNTAAVNCWVIEYSSWGD